MADKIDKKEQILDAAEKIFGELGYEGASTRTLAGEACVNMAMINYYFGSKEGLMKAVVERRVSGLSKLFEEVMAQDITPWEKLKQVIHLYVARVATNKYFHKIIFREISLARHSSEVSEFVLDNIHGNMKCLEIIIQDGIAKGDFRKVDVEMTVTTIFGTIYSLINSRRLGSRMLSMNLLDNEVFQQELKPRLESYLQDFLQAHLLIK